MDFFGMDVSEGRIWNEDDFKDSHNEMPILLGSSYRNLYSIDDELIINHYNKTLTVKIIGFLKENSRVYFNNDVEFYLNKHVLLPYINYENDPTSKTDEIFQQASYFAMINGYIITDDNQSGIQNMIQRIEAIAQKHSVNYSFIGMNPHFNK